MPRIALTTSAIDRLLDDPKFCQWQNGELGRRVPFLGYFQRSYTTSYDAKVTEHGDGFMLTTVDPTDDEGTKGVVIRSVAVADGLDILVGGNASIMSEDFIIGWSKWTYTREIAGSQDEADEPAR